MEQATLSKEGTGGLRLNKSINKICKGFRGQFKALKMKTGWEGTETEGETEVHSKIGRHTSSEDLSVFKSELHSWKTYTTLDVKLWCSIIVKSAS